MSNENGNGKVVFGYRSWDEPVVEPFKKKKSFNPEDRIPFMKLAKSGPNEMRIITGFYTYWQAKMKLPGTKGLGERINSAWPLVDASECPVKQAGLVPKERCMVGVIERSSGEVKIFDMSPLVKQALDGFRKNVRFGSPEKFDINVEVSGSGVPATYYSTQAYPPEPLSPADVALKEAKLAALEESLTRLTTPPKPERVLEKMKAAGYAGGLIVDPEAKTNGAKEAPLPATEEDDYNFAAPATN